MYVGICEVDHHEDRDQMLKLNRGGEKVLLFDWHVFSQGFPLQLAKHEWMANLYAVEIKVGEHKY